MWRLLSGMNICRRPGQGPSTSAKNIDQSISTGGAFNTWQAMVGGFIIDALWSQFEYVGRCK